MTDAESNGAPRHIGREAAVRRLKQFYKVSLADCEENIGEAICEETDRGTVVLLSTAIEDALRQRLEADMVTLSADDSERLFGPDAPLGSFSAKIKTAYAFGMIDRETLRLCDLIREMRNACAHSGRPISFADEALSGVLQAAWSYLTDEDVDFSSKKIPLWGRVNFLWLVSWVQMVIKRGSKDFATETINRLIAEAGEDARDAAVKHQASLKKRRERSALKNQSRRKA